MVVKIGNTTLHVEGALKMGKTKFIKAHAGLIKDPEAAWDSIQPKKKKSETEE